MIGNDVVDLILAKTESNWRRKGFLDKLYTASEQSLIQNANNQDEMVWLLWSIKESVYKAYQRINYNHGFYPIKIKIQSLELVDAEYESVIQLFDITFFGKSTIKNQIIQTVVVERKIDFEKVIYLDCVAYIKNKNGLPVEVLSGKPISVSHHGRSKIIVGFS